MKKYYRLLEILCCLVYFTSYITRINFGAVVAEIVTAEGFAKSTVSIVVVMGFISYGVGQLISGVLGDIFSAKRLIFTGFLATSACNLALPFCTAVPVMAVIWFFNGLAQAMMWPPLMKLMTQYLAGPRFSRVSANVVAASAVGTIFVYLTAPLFIRLESWRTVFYFSGGAGIVVAVVWITVLPRILAHLKPVVFAQKPETKEQADSVKNIIWKYGLVFICVAIIAQGLIRDGITTWMPSCIVEVFHMEAASSILVSVVLPLFAIFSLKLFSLIQQKWVKNEIKLSAVLFLICVVLISLWSVFYDGNVILSVLLPALVIGLVHGINLMLVCVVPKRFAGGGRVSMISGMLNFFTYVGSALSAYGMARLSEIFGWQATIWSWAAAAFMGLVMCCVCIRKFNEPSI